MRKLGENPVLLWTFVLRLHWRLGRKLIRSVPKEFAYMVRQFARDLWILSDCPLANW